MYQQFILNILLCRMVSIMAAMTFENLYITFDFIIWDAKLYIFNERVYQYFVYLCRCI